MYLFLWVFFIYAFFGWCTEVSYAALTSGKFVNRGFLNGPVCPIYGFGVVIVLFCLEPLRHNLLLLFVGSVLLTSALEWATGVALEKLFHQRWWDYSDQPFNLGGYICLRFSIAWGLACLFVVKLLHPTVLLTIRLIPRPVGLMLLAVLGTAMAVDLAATLRTIAKLNRNLGQIDELACKIKAASNEFGENLADKVLGAAERSAGLREELAERTSDLRDGLQERTGGILRDLADRGEDLKENLAELKGDLADRREERQLGQALRRAERQENLEALRHRLAELMDRRIFGQRRLLSAFPKMRSLDHRQALEALRRRMAQLREPKTD